MNRHPVSDWTYSDYARLPDDGQHYEVIDGEVCVTPGPRPLHQEVFGSVFVLLRAYVLEHKLGKVYQDVDRLFVEGQFLRPDLVFVATARLHGVTNRGVEVAPDVVVEILSPHSKRIDRVPKPPRYRDFGVPAYWVVDPDAEAVEMYPLASGSVTPQLKRETLTFQPDVSVPPFLVRVSAIFGESR